MVGYSMSTFSHELAVGKSRSLRRGLLFWFLILSLFPVSVVSWVSFQQAEKNLSELVISRLEENADLKAKFVRTWFEDRFIDASNYAKSRLSSELLSSLREGFELSGLALSKYVQIREFSVRVDAFQDDLVTMYDHYDYIHNILLVDPSGNILYSVENQNDLGTNVFKKGSVYAETLFSKALAITLKEQSSNFSDLERLTSHKNSHSAFISTPIKKQSGDILGAIVVELSLDRIFTLLKSRGEQSYKYQYLVNNNNYLLTPISDSARDAVLAPEALSNELVQIDDLKRVKSYINPIGKEAVSYTHLTLPTKA